MAHISVEAVRACCKSNTLVDVYIALMDLMAEDWGKQSWLCKSLANVHFLPQIEATVPDAKYLYLYRDGRDVCLSFLSAIVGEKTAYHVAKQWHQEQ